MRVDQVYLRRTVVTNVEVGTIANTVATAENVRFRPDQLKKILKFQADIYIGAESIDIHCKYH